jgi:hypothetical protein
MFQFSQLNFYHKHFSNCFGQVSRWIHHALCGNKCFTVQYAVR